MDDFDKQASKILTENIDGLRWSEEENIKDLATTDDLEFADIGDAFLFDDVDDLGQHMGVFGDGTDESVVLQFLSRFGAWDFKDNPNGAIVIKTHDLVGDLGFKPALHERI